MIKKRLETGAFLFDKPYRNGETSFSSNRLPVQAE